MPYVLIAGKIDDAGVALLRSSQGITIEHVADAAPDAYLPYLETADALLLRTQPLRAEDIANAPKLKIVSRHGVGYDAVDVAALSAKGIPLAIVGDVNSRAVAEHTLMLMLAAARRAATYDAAVRSGQWNARNAFDGQELDSKTLLVLGFGRIGRRVTELARAFGMEVHAFDPYVPCDIIAAEGVIPAEDLHQGLAAADYVSAHMPGMKNRAMIGEAEIARMKRTAILINTARGGLIDETALGNALRDGRIAAAALDVLVQEPPPSDHILLSNPRVLLTPHTAGLTAECARRMAISAAQNILDCFAGRLDPRLVVNAAEIGLKVQS